jgi:hypothetical protein
MDLFGAIAGATKPEGINRVVKGIFTSVWDGDVEIPTPAVLDLDTGEITTSCVEVDGITVLKEEYFDDENGKRYKVCPVCHNHIIKGTACTDPHCDFNVN